MRKFAFGLLLVVAAVGWYGYQYQSNNLETKPLNADERKRIAAGGAYVELADGVVHYELANADASATVVLVHGFSVPYYLWDGTFETLAKEGYRVLRYDLYGRGYSDRPPLENNAALFDRQLVQLLNALRIAGPVHLVGASMGGPITAGFVCRHRGRVKSLTLIGPGYSKGNPLPWRIMTPVIGEYLFATQTAPRLAESQKADFKHPERFPDWAERYKPQMQYYGFRRSLLSSLRHYVTSDWSAEYACVAKSDVPVLMMWGKDDKDVPVSLTKEFQRLMPKADLMVIDDAAHVPFLEKPEIVMPAMLRHIATAAN